jgi:hypothetical protein
MVAVEVVGVSREVAGGVIAAMVASKMKREGMAARKL